MQPIDEDKFLCYSCNNWLINWHSLQNKNNESQPSKSGHSSNNSHSSVIPEEAHEKMGVLSDCQLHQQHQQTTDLLQIRARLQKYFYIPAKHKPEQENRDMFRVTITFKCKLCRKTFVKSRGAIRRNLRDDVWRFCKSCKRELRKHFGNGTRRQSIADNQRNTKNIENHSSQTVNRKLVNPILVHRLRQLGTTIMPEDAAKKTKFTQMPYVPVQQQYVDGEHNGNNRFCSNDILISFDKTVTEVFPLYFDVTKNDFLIDDNSGGSGVLRKNVNEVFKQIPKSISISVA